MSTLPASRPNYFQFYNGEKATLPFSENEYQNRLAGLQAYMQSAELEIVVLTSMHNVAYYTGCLLYTSPSPRDRG